ncbi:MAG TPA: hypothetical protein QGH92_01680 [Candidatus Parcubacteria bacterium]|nr:hypothetical protein [Candidatus Parcubacteria bacterium]
MVEKRLPKSVRKFIRREKARIRREVLDIKEEKKLIEELYQGFFNKLEGKDNKKKPVEEKLSLTKA